MDDDRRLNDEQLRRRVRFLEDVLRSFLGEQAWQVNAARAEKLQAERDANWCLCKDNRFAHDETCGCACHIRPALPGGQVAG
jgi:hypothetical protein